MKQNTAMNITGNFTQSTKDQAETENIDANVPLQVQKAK